MAIEKNTTATAKAKPADKPAPSTKPVAKAAPAPKPAAPKTAPAPTAALPGLVTRISRKDLAQAITAKVKAAGKAVPHEIAEIMVVAYEETVSEALAQGLEVNLPGFGKFVAVEKPQAEKRNPSNGEMVTVPAHKAPKFKVGSGLKKACNPEKA